MGDKATPRPWKAYAANKESDCYIQGPGGTVAVVEKLEDAELICRAVNAHDELVAALDMFTVEDCSYCDGTGKDENTMDDACEECGGAGLVYEQWPDPHMILNALSRARGTDKED